MLGGGQDHRGVSHLLLGLENVLAPEGVPGVQRQAVVEYVQYFHLYKWNDCRPL